MKMIPITSVIYNTKMSKVSQYIKHACSKKKEKNVVPPKRPSIHNS